MKIGWQILEVGMGVFIVVGLAYGLIVPQIHMARQEKALQKLQQDLESLKTKIQKTSPQDFMTSLSGSI